MRHGATEHEVSVQIGYFMQFLEKNIFYMDLQPTPIRFWGLVKMRLGTDLDILFNSQEKEFW